MQASSKTDGDWGTWAATCCLPDTLAHSCICSRAAWVAPSTPMLDLGGPGLSLATEAWYLPSGKRAMS